MERLCLEAGGDHQFMVGNSLILPKEMEIAIIMGDMVTLKESVIKSKVIPREVEGIADHNSLIFTKEMDNMAIQDQIEVVLYLPCNMCWIV